MSFMNKYLTLLLGLLLSLSAAAQDKPLVVASFTILADMAKNIGGDTVLVKSLIKAGNDIHNYQPTPQDLKNFYNAQLLLWNGLHLEQELNRFLEAEQKDKIVIASASVKPLSIYKGAYKGKPNPHAWMAVSNALIYIDNITQALTNLLPQHQDLYAQNAKNYKDKLRQIHQHITARLQAVPPAKRFLVTSEGAFSYLAKEYNLKELYLWPINAKQQGTPQQIRDTILSVKKNNIPVVFSESTISDKPIKQVAAETGAKYGGVLYVDSLSVPGGVVDSYLTLLAVTANTIADGFVDAQ